MPAPPRDQIGAEIVTPENVLLDAVERIGRIRDGRAAVHLHLSRLKAENRQEGYLRVAARTLEPMVTAYGGQIFQLSNDDLVLLLNQPNPADLHDQLHKLRGLFAKDPLASEDDGDGADLFCTIHDLTFDYEIFVGIVKQALADVRLQLRRPAGAPELKPLDPTALSQLIEKMGMLDATPFVRRQSAVALDGHGRAEVIFQEFSIGLADLQKALAPDLDLQSDRWMYRHLMAFLDQRLLAAVRNLRLTHMPPAIHLNLALSSLSDPLFLDFERYLPEGTILGVEMQILDMLADSRGFFASRDALRRKGFRLALDGLDESTLRFLDVARAGADLLKIEWSPELPQRAEALLATIKHVDRSKFLLARCDSEIAIAWGIENGFGKFQGRFIESMLAATTMAVCDKAAACTLAQCTSRHGVIAGPLRKECGNNLMLDKPPSMRAPQKRAKAQ